MKKLLLASVISVIIAMPILTEAASHPRGVAADHRIKVVQYDPNNIVILKARYGYQTQITFDEGETVQNVSIGDGMAWLAVPVNNNLFIKPVAESTTNMTVLTNLNSYNFQLDSSNAQVAPTYKLQFNYSDSAYDQTGNSNAITSLDPDKLNYKYSFTGDKTLAPEEVFDNGQFTYFQFKRNALNRMPAIFIVDKNRNETLVNYHMQDDYVVVNSVAKQFTLRDGNYVTSVYNNFAIDDWKNMH